MIPKQGRGGGRPVRSPINLYHCSRCFLCVHWMCGGRPSARRKRTASVTKFHKMVDFSLSCVLCYSVRGRLVPSICWGFFWRWLMSTHWKFSLPVWRTAPNRKSEMSHVAESYFETRLGRWSEVSACSWSTGSRLTDVSWHVKHTRTTTVRCAGIHQNFSSCRLFSRRLTCLLSLP